jgi:guanylate kinase
MLIYTKSIHNQNNKKRITLLPSRTLRKFRQKPKGLLVVISAPSGAGKTTIAHAVIQQIPDVVRSVSMTSRPIRQGEIEGKDYFFVSKTEFIRRMKQGQFLEWAEVHENLYGTPKTWVNKQIAQGKIVLLVIDVQGAEQIKEVYPECVSIFILPPSMQELKNRLKKRNTETKATLTVRIRNAMIEYQFVKDYDYAVINDDLNKAVEKVRAILAAEKCRVHRWLTPK